MHNTASLGEALTFESLGMLTDLVDTRLPVLLMSHDIFTVESESRPSHRYLSTGYLLVPSVIRG